LSSVEQLLRAGTESLAAAGIERPRSEARVLLEAATGRSRTTLLAAPERPVAASDGQRYRGWLDRRARREPVAYILGRAEFWSLTFAVGPGVLVPRPETETLVEAALRAFPDRGRPLRVLDLGVGSGCLLLTLLFCFANARGVGTDTSDEALACARLNTERLGVGARAELRAADWHAGLDGPFDVVVANPPYIPSAEIATLEPEVSRFEPRAALDGGADGLDAYRAICPALPALLGPDGSAFLEIGAGQEGQVARIAVGAGMGGLTVHRDLSGTARCLELRPRTA
jgi:release factor glutamine methyltransferase